MYLITNRHMCSEYRYLEVIKESILSGIENIIIREKDMDDTDLENLVESIKVIVNNLKSTVIKKNFKQTKLIINNNLNLYEKLDLDGVHLSFKPFLDLIKNNYKFKNNKVLGVSLHSTEEVKLIDKISSNLNIRVDYVTLSHIYKTDCKKDVEPRGLKLLKESRKLTNIKIVALGGINSENMSEVKQFCDDVAVMSMIMKSKSLPL